MRSISNTAAFVATLASVGGVKALPSSTTNPCYVTEYTAVPAAVASCTDITLDGIHVPGGQTLDLTALKDGTTVTFAGTTTFGFEEANYNLIEASGTDVTITSKPGAVLNGNGQAWWDGLGSNGGLTKPDHFFVVSNMKGSSTVRDLYIENYPVHCFEVTYCVGLVMENIVINNSAGNAPNNRSDGLPAAHNSDGFDVSSCNDTIIRNNWVSNQDDCVAITSGVGVTVSGMYCYNSHGLSIGSVGGKSNNVVENIIFQDSVCNQCQNGVRIKTNADTTGYISNVTYSNIGIVNASTYGLDIQQDYLNGGPTGVPTNGVIITDITMKNIIGTAAKDADDYYILCGDGSCSNFYFENVHIVGGDNSSCNYQPQGNFVCSH